jgi:molybdopterin/thiamine biosynthesis adenylyltransferase
MSYPFDPRARPRLRDSIVVTTGPDGRLDLKSPYERIVLTFEVETWVPQVLALMDGSRTAGELAHTASPPVSSGDVEAVLDVLASEHLLAVSEKSADTSGRHSRQLRLFDDMISAGDSIEATTSDEAQSRLQSARVVVVGVGGAGSSVVQALAAAGVGSLDLIDADVVELSHLNRQVLFESDDIGSVKVQAAQRRLRRIDPSLRVTCWNLSVETATDLLAVVEGADLVVNCADQPTVTVASDVVAAACMEVAVPHIVGGAYGAVLGAPGVSIVPGETVCWFCVRAATADDDRPAVEVLRQAGPAGSIAPITGIVGNLTAWEAVRLLLGLRPTLTNSVRELDLATLEWHVRAITPRESCRCGRSSP